MISEKVKNLAHKVFPEYSKTNDLIHLEREIIMAEESIATSQDSFDNEDMAFILYHKHRVNYFKYGHDFPIDVLDRGVLDGHISSIISRIVESKYSPLSQEIAASLKDSISKIFKSNDKATISQISDVLAWSFYNQNALGLTEKQNEAIDTAKEDYKRKSYKVKIGKTYIHFLELSVAEWKELINVIFKIIQTDAINELSWKKYPIGKKLYLVTHKSEYDTEYEIEIFYQNHTLLKTFIDYSHSMSDILEIVGDIKLRLIDHAETDVQFGKTFISELQEKNPNVDWLNLPTSSEDIRATLFRPE